MLRPVKLSMPVSSEHWQLHTIAKCCQHMSVIWSRRLLLAWSPPVSPVMPKVPPANRGRDLTVRNTNDLFSWQIKDRNGAFLAGKAFELLSVEQNIQNRYIPLISTDLPFISFFLPFSVPSGMVEQQQPICCASALSKQTAPLWMQMSRRYSLLGPVETRRSPHCSLSFSPFQSSAMKHEPCGHRVKILAKQQN